MTRLFLLLVCLQGAMGYYCGCWESVYEKGFYGMMCTGYMLPSEIEGYRKIDDWFTVDCRQCGSGFSKCANRSREMPQRRPLIHVGEEAQSEKPQSRQLVRPNSASEWTGGADLYWCCAYASKLYYYTEQIHTDCPNPTWQNGCKESDLGDQLIGQWYVKSMYNQCFFETARDD
eukprot:TRINITY_DN104399_c0_g1_i1.p2 TRINITY_DN104399_c0_g1~~TRINITY_DN104399_c0_g1_i1.p2  ORF type:complete len:174 (+),score=13.69 TRINITY_DN104399_c0_g1_i1:22-543(+)